MAASQDTAPTWEQVTATAKRLLAGGSATPEDGLRLAQMVVEFDQNVHGRSSRPPPRQTAE
jgi:hypothetical protein